MWQWINWARPRIISLETSLSAAHHQILDLEERLFGSHPSRPTTSTSAVDAREQFIIDNEELGRNSTNAIRNIPQDLATKL